MKWQRKTASDHEIAPDEIFLDSSNAPDFDRSRLEGRIERPLSRSTYLTLAGFFAILFLSLISRAFQMQVIEGESYAAQSSDNALAETTLFAPRGIIVDRNGEVLAENSEGPDGTIRRKYLLPEMGQIIGYVSNPKKDSSGRYYDTDQRGLAGLEFMYDDVLRGRNGKVLIETDALGALRSKGTVIPAEEGGTLALSIDATLERTLFDAIKEIVIRRGFRAGAGVILNTKTGSVQAIVSYPSYDPNVLANGTPAETIASYNADPRHPFLDHAVQGVYTPGSVVKPLIASGALSDGLITSKTVIDDQGVLIVPDRYNPGKEYRYTGWRALGPVDVKKAIAWSSDIFFYTVGGGFQNQRGLGIDRLAYWYDQFGLGKPTGIDLPGEVSGVIPSPAWKKKTFNESWYLGDTYYTAIGQYGMQVTPIQMARAIAAVANGGTLCTPTLILNASPSCTSLSIPDQVYRVVREGMRLTVTDALAQQLNVPYLSVAAKTGTAQVGANNEFDNSWVVGFFPVEKPEYAFAIVLERGPIGTGETAVTAMRLFLDDLQAAGSPYIGAIPKERRLVER